MIDYDGEKLFNEEIFIGFIGYTLVIGMITGLLWGTFFGINVPISLFSGAVVGIIIAVVFAFWESAITSNSTYLKSEEVAVVFMAYLLIIGGVSIGGGVLVWIIKFIFFKAN